MCFFVSAEYLLFINLLLFFCFIKYMRYKNLWLMYLYGRLVLLRIVLSNNLVVADFLSFFCFFGLLMFSRICIYFLQFIFHLWKHRKLFFHLLSVLLIVRYPVIQTNKTSLWRTNFRDTKDHKNSMIYNSFHKIITHRFITLIHIDFK